MFNFKKRFNEILYKKVILSDKECDLISKFILDNEEEIKSFGPDVYAGTNENSLTGRYSIFNFLNNLEIKKILEPKFRKIFNDLKLVYPLYVQCWANTYREGDYIKPHSHGNGLPNSISGNIFLTGIKYPGTKYFFKNEIVNIKNKKGEIIMFGPNLVHSVDPYSGNEVRITMAIDVHFEIEKYYSYSECLNEFELNKSRYYKFE